MDLQRCWPYEELKVEKLGDDPRAFHFQTPWHSSVVRTTDEGAALFDRLFLQDVTALSPEHLLDGFSKALSGLIHEPYAYVLPDLGAVSTLLDEVAGPAPRMARDSAEASGGADWTWDAETALALAQIPGTDFYSPLSLFSVMRRFFFLQASETDRTRDLYASLGELSPADARDALAFVISQNLFVTQRCDEALSAALPRAGAGESVLMDFIASERGHDRIMEAALRELPQVSPGALDVHPSTADLMDVFTRVAQNHFLAFAFAVNLFERPHVGEVHPLTALLRKFGFVAAAEKYEQHHQINEAGDHDQVGLELIREMPPVTRKYAEKALRWGELMTHTMINQGRGLLSRVRPTFSYP